MIHLHQIASDDFILLEADQRVAEAVETVQRLNPAAVVVHRVHKDAIYYYHRFVKGPLEAEKATLISGHFYDGTSVLRLLTCPNPRKCAEIQPKTR